MDLVQPNFKDKLVLVVEDTYFNYLLLKEFITRAGANVIWAKDSGEAIGKYNENDCDLVLLDIQLDHDDEGFGVLEKIRAIKGKKPIKIIAQTAFSMHDEHRKIMDAGFDGYLAKPIGKEKLIEVMKDAFSDNA